MRDLIARDYAAKNTPNPCHGCGERKVGCHGSCDKYTSFVSDFRKTSHEMYLEQKRQNLADDFRYACALGYKHQCQVDKRRRREK